MNSNRDLTPHVFFGASIAVAAAYFFFLLDGTAILQGNLWRYGTGDYGQHLVGYVAFTHDQWRLPLLATRSLGHPHGTRIIFTDSLPLVAIPSKLLRAFLPLSFHPFGFWIFLCLLLLAHSFSGLQFELGHRTLFASVASSLFAVTAPFFLFRFQLSQAALCGQFLLVYSIWLYFRQGRLSERAAQLGWWVLLLIASLLTHVYLLAMVGVLFIAAEGRLLSTGEASLRDVSLHLMTALVVILGLATVGGYWPSDVFLTDPNAYGHFSMNLLAPFSRDYVRYDATGGQLDGFNYWGVGTFLLLVANVRCLGRWSRMLFRADLYPLVLCLLVLAIFAVSNRVYLGHLLLFSYDLPGTLTTLASHFRGSGRFFWPVSYSVMALALCAGLSMRPRLLAVAAVSVALALQLMDTISIRMVIQDEIGSSEQPPVAESRLRRIVAQHKLLILVPPAQCGSSLRAYSVVGRLAAEEGIPLQSVWAGRYAKQDMQSCRTASRDLITQGFQPDTLYVVDEPTIRSVSVRPNLAAYCGHLGSYNICTLKREETGIPAMRPMQGVTEWTQQGPIPVGQQTLFLGAGWSYVELAGVWSVGNHSELLFRLPSCTAATAIRLRVLPFTGPEGQTLRVSADEAPEVIHHFSARTTEDISVPFGTCNPDDRSVKVTLKVDYPLSTLDTGEGRDARPLGVFLFEAELE